MRRFRDRSHAGQELAKRLAAYADRDDVLVLALPRGGVPVGFEVARALNAPLDVFLVRKLGLPGHEEFAIGAIASGGLTLLNRDVIRAYGVSDAALQSVVDRERAELERREQAYRSARGFPSLQGKTIILVDDGLATGSTMRAAAAAVRERKPSRVVIAVPIAPPETCAALRDAADEIVCGATPERFYAVGLWYEDFAQMDDDDVREILTRAERELPPLPASEAT